MGVWPEATGEEEGATGFTADILRPARAGELITSQFPRHPAWQWRSGVQEAFEVFFGEDAFVAGDAAPVFLNTA